jgi:membrane protein YdbS with pleckstrin-like domain
MFQLLRSPGFQTLGVQISLIVGNLLNWWSFTSTMFVYLFEIVFVVLIAIFYELFSKKVVINLSALLFGGALIVLIGYFETIFIGIEIGELDPNTFRLDDDQIIRPILEHIWPILIFTALFILNDFFQMNKKDRMLSIQTTLFYRIMLIIGTVTVASGFLYFLDGLYKSIVLSIVILLRLFLEIYLDPNRFLIFKKKSN